MVPSSSAQREPSMEEILASIRRIIEDNDSGQKPSSAAREMPAADPADDEETEENVIAVDAFRNELRVPAEEKRPEAKIEQAAAQDNVRKDEAAGDADEADLSPPPARWDTDRAPASERLAAEERIRMAIDNARARTAEMKRQEEADQVSINEDAADGAEDEAHAQPQAAAPEPFPATIAPSVPAVSKSADGENSSLARTAILSEQAERKIAASFGELSEAFAARSQKTFDDMAQEMLQPMLRDWLDNNLPVLVERLVREEIERVARGSQ
jgi:uncharacterized protein